MDKTARLALVPPLILKCTAGTCPKVCLEGCNSLHWSLIVITSNTQKYVIIPSFLPELDGSIVMQFYYMDLIDSVCRVVQALSCI